MSQPCMVLIAAPDLMPKLKEKVGPATGDLLTFSDTDALRALEAILKRKPDVVALERLFSATPRGNALVNRIKADPTLTHAEIRVVAQDGTQTVVSAPPGAATSAAPAAAKGAPAAKPGTVTKPAAARAATAPSTDIWSGAQPRRVDIAPTPAAPSAATASVATPAPVRPTTPAAPTPVVPAARVEPPAPAAPPTPVAPAAPVKPAPAAAPIKPVATPPLSSAPPPAAPPAPVAARSAAPASAVVEPRPAVAVAPPAPPPAEIAEAVPAAAPVLVEAPAEPIDLAAAIDLTPAPSVEAPSETIEAIAEAEPLVDVAPDLESIELADAELLSIDLPLHDTPELTLKDMPVEVTTSEEFALVTNAGEVVALEPSVAAPVEISIDASPAEPAAPVIASATAGPTPAAAAPAVTMSPSTPAAAATPPAASTPAISEAPAPARAAVAPALDQKGTRRAPRFKVADTAGLLLDGAAATLVDLSTVGAQVLSKAVLKPNQRVRLALTDKQGSVKVSGSVAWALFEIPPRYRAGIDFTDADPKAVDAFCSRHKLP